MSGMSPLDPATILNWCALTKQSLAQEEIEVLLAADTAYRRAYNLETEHQRERAKLRTPGQAPVTMKVLDDG